MDRKFFVQDTFELLNHAKSDKVVTSILKTAFDELGYSSFIALDLPAQIRSNQPLFISARVPDGWHEAYIEAKFYATDHIARHARASSHAFCFESAPYSPSEQPDAQRLRDALKSFGLNAGLVVPTGPMLSQSSCMTVFGNDHLEYPEIRQQVESVALYGMYCLRRNSSLKRKLVKRLTLREREVLQWIAAGKTSWEVSSILSISERSVNDLITHAMTKLNTVTRTQTVVAAIRNGEIEP